MLGKVSALLYLFINRAGNLIVTLAALPLYRVVFSENQLSVVIFSLIVQATLLMLDFGKSARFLQVAQEKFQSNLDLVSDLRREEWALCKSYLLVLPVIMLILVLMLNKDPANIFLIFITAAAGVYGNIYQTALISVGERRLVAVWSIVGNLMKVVGPICIFEIVPSLNLFFLFQFVVTFLFGSGFRSALVSLNSGADKTATHYPIRSHADYVVLSVVGTVLIQADRLGVNLSNSGIESSDYYYASAISAVPTSLLALPIVQYFQPKLTAAVLRGSAVDELLKKFYFLVAFLSIFPTLCLWLFLDLVVGIWVGDSNVHAVTNIVAYSKVLMISGIIGALCFPLSSLLQVIRRERFLARLGVACSLPYAIACFVLPNMLNVISVTYVVLIYNLTTLFALSVYVANIRRCGSRSVIWLPLVGCALAILLIF